MKLKNLKYLPVFYRFPILMKKNIGISDIYKGFKGIDISEYYECESISLRTSSKPISKMINM